LTQSHFACSGVLKIKIPFYKKSIWHQNISKFFMSSWDYESSVSRIHFKSFKLKHLQYLITEEIMIQSILNF
jgi:hypothetical protein